MALCLALAGCGGKGGAPPTTTAAPSSGQVQGRVLDESAAPIAGAEIRILLTDLSRRTDGAGEFNFSHVPAGPVRLVASADGFSSQTRSGTLQAGTVLRVDFELTAAARIVPYNRTLTFEGRIDCGLPQGAACPAQGATGSATTHHFGVDAFLKGVIVQLRWTPPAEQVNQELAVDIQAATAQTCGQTYQSAKGPSVLRMEVAQGYPITGGHQCLQVRPPGDAPTVQQDYEAYVTLFYHEPPPPGFSAAA